jgi:hypothetical protein
MKKALTIALVAAVVAIAGAGTASAQATGTTDIDIDFPNLLVLYYYDAIQVDINATDVLTLIGATPTSIVGDVAAIEQSGSAITASAGGTDLEATLEVVDDSLGLGGLNSVQLDLLGVWGVRSLSGTARLQVAPTANTTLLGPGGVSAIGVSAPQIRLQSAGPDWTAASTNLEFTTLGLGSLQRGDIQLTLNLTGVTVGGLHSSGADGTYVVSASRP